MRHCRLSVISFNKSSVRTGLVFPAEVWSLVFHSHFNPNYYGYLICDIYMLFFHNALPYFDLCRTLKHSKTCHGLRPFFPISG